MLQDMLRYISDHWRGKLALSTAFWVNTLGLALAVSALAAAPVVLAPTEDPNPSRIWLLLGAFMPVAPVLLAVSVWQIVGLWRSAERYRAGASRQLWRRALPFVCVASALAVIGGLLDGLFWSGRILLSQALIATIDQAY